MGGQRVFLAILATVVIGIAAIFAINWLDDINNDMKVKAVRHDLTSLAEAVQAYALKPEIMGGGGGDFVDMEWSDLKELSCNVTSVADTSCINKNGVYTFSELADTMLILHGYPSAIVDSTALAIVITPRSIKLAGPTVVSN